MSRQRFEELTEGQDPATVWRDRAFKLADELDAASLHHPTGERITRKDLNNAFRQGVENGRLAAQMIDMLANATDDFVDDGNCCAGKLAAPAATVGQPPLNMLASRDQLREKIARDPDIEEGEARPAPTAVKVKPLEWININTHGGPAISALCIGREWRLQTQGLRQADIDEFKAKAQAECESYLFDMLEIVVRG